VGEWKFPSGPPHSRSFRTGIIEQNENEPCSSRRINRYFAFFFSYLSFSLWQPSPEPTDLFSPNHPGHCTSPHTPPFPRRLPQTVSVFPKLGPHNVLPLRFRRFWTWFFLNIPVPFYYFELSMLTTLELETPTAAILRRFGF